MNSTCYYYPSMPRCLHNNGCINQSTLDQQFTRANLRGEFGVLAIEQVGMNNLPKPTQQSLTALFGSASEVFSDAERVSGLTAFARHSQDDNHVAGLRAASGDAAG